MQLASTTIGIPLWSYQWEAEEVWLPIIVDGTMHASARSEVGQAEVYAATIDWQDAKLHTASELSSLKAGWLASSKSFREARHACTHIPHACIYIYI